MTVPRATPRRPGLASRLMPTILRLHRSKARYASAAATRAHIQELERAPAGWAPPVRLDRSVRVVLRTVGGRPVSRLSPRGATSGAPIIYLHGGAWIHEISSR